MYAFPMASYFGSNGSRLPARSRTNRRRRSPLSRTRSTNPLLSSPSTMWVMSPVVRAGRVYHPASRTRAIRLRGDQVQALGIGRVQADGLRDCLVQEDRLRADLPSEVRESSQQFSPLLVFSGFSA